VPASELSAFSAERLDAIPGLREIRRYGAASDCCGSRGGTVDPSETPDETTGTSICSTRRAVSREVGEKWLVMRWWEGTPSARARR